MSISLNGLLSMGAGALSASQACINTTGNNIANVDTTGYTRQSVLLKSSVSIASGMGQLGTGVDAQSVLRSYDKFIEGALVQQLGAASRYDSAYYAIASVESLFNESTVDGIGSYLNNFFTSWNDLAQTPDSLAAREALLETSQTLTSLLRSTDNSLAAMQEELNSLIRQEVSNANTLMTEIADLNRQIAILSSDKGEANTLLDARDAKVRELAEIIDITMNDRGNGDLMITTSSGYTLVQGDVAFSLAIQGASVENNLSSGSPYKNSAGSGTIGFSGTDTKEYTVEIVSGGAVDGGAAQFKVSLDGGKTWMTDDNGDVRLFDVNSEANGVTAGELTLWFDAGESLAAGDTFTISPKSDVYWVSPTSGPVNISPQIYADGTENPSRMSGGALAGYLTARDEMIGGYRDDLESLAQTLIWEVNRIHSQGAGLTSMTSALGTYAVTRPDLPLANDASGCVWGDYLSEGNISFSIYDAVTGESMIPYPGIEVFSATNFDPETMSLDDVASAITNASFTDADGNTVNPFKARVVNGQLEITSSDPTKYTFGVASDTTGLLAATGINTFFTGTGASDIAIRADVASNANMVNAGRVNGAGESNNGDNAIANDIAELASKAVAVSGSINQSITDLYATLVTRVGADSLAVKSSSARETLLAQNLDDRREEVSGVSLDEELTNLVKFQSSYKAAAKLITTANEMLETVLGLKQ